MEVLRIADLNMRPFVQEPTIMMRPPATYRPSLRIWTRRRKPRRSTPTSPVPQTPRTCSLSSMLLPTSSSRTTLRTAASSRVGVAGCQGRLPMSSCTGHVHYNSFTHGHTPLSATGMGASPWMSGMKYHSAHLSMLVVVWNLHWFSSTTSMLIMKRAKCVPRHLCMNIMMNCFQALPSLHTHFDMLSTCHSVFTHSPSPFISTHSLSLYVFLVGDVTRQLMLWSPDVTCFHTCAPCRITWNSSKNQKDEVRPWGQPACTGLQRFPALICFCV